MREWRQLVEGNLSAAEFTLFLVQLTIGLFFVALAILYVLYLVGRIRLPEEARKPAAYVFFSIVAVGLGQLALAQHGRTQIAKVEPVIERIDQGEITLTRSLQSLQPLPSSRPSSILMPGPSSDRTTPGAGESARPMSAVIPGGRVPEPQSSSSTDAAPNPGSAATRVFVQFARPDQASAANRLNDVMRQAGLRAMPTENVGNRSTRVLEVRYFDDQDRAQAEQVARLVTDTLKQTPQISKLNLPAAGSGFVEVWLPRS